LKKYQRHKDSKGEEKQARRNKERMLRMRKPEK
jgi:hypothetical protein